MQQTYEFHIHRSDKNGEFYWHLKAGNGEIVATSGETHEGLGGCLGGLYRFRQSAPDAPINDRTKRGSDARIADEEFEIYIDESAKREARWRFQAGNNRVIATGAEGYSSVSAVRKAIERVKAHAGSAEVIDKTDEPVDVEECAKHGHRPPRARRYRIRIDKQRYVVDRPSMTGRDLLGLAGKTPVTRFRIDQKLRGGQTKQIGYGEEVLICAPGVERFMTIPLDQREGER